MIFQESGVTFNNVKKIGTKISSFPVGNPDNYEYEENSLSRKDTEHIENKGGFVNAIDIDWDGVEVETISPDCSILILNTTSDLLNWIKCLENRISALEGGGGNVRPIDPDDYRITWNDNGATTAHYGGSDFVYPGETVVLPTTNPKREYTITWDANGGTGTITTKVTYTFNNWWTTASGGTQVTLNTKPTATATYYANWISPSGIILPTTNPTRSGYNFMGWATTSSATTPNVTSSTVPTGDVTYYAVWLKQNAVLSFIRWTNTTASSVEGESINLPTITLVYSDNHTDSILATFATLEKDGNSFELTTDTSAGIYDNITAIYNEFRTKNTLTYTIKARPVTEYTVEFIDRGNILGRTKGPTGTQVTKPSDPSRSGYTFIGWNETQNAGIGGTVITTIGTDNITYYAQWKEVTPVVTQYTVTYHSNGGNSTPSPQTVNAGETVTLAGAITRDADSSYTYEFSHWYTNSSGTDINYSAGQTIPVNDNIDLYAQWISTPIPVEQYTVTFDANGGNSTPSPIKVDKNTTITLPAAITRDADESYTYSFKNWNTHRDGKGSGYDAEQNYTVTTNVTLYAQWNKKAITPVTTDYYWYAGQTQPSNMSSNPTVDNTNFTVNKWHTLNSDQISQTITGGTAGNSWYVAVPTTKGFSAYASDLVTPNTAWSKISTITVNSISYDVWKPASTGAKMNIYMK